MAVIDFSHHPIAKCHAAFCKGVIQSAYQLPRDEGGNGGRDPLPGVDTGLQPHVGGPGPGLTSNVVLVQ